MNAIAQALAEIDDAANQRWREDVARFDLVGLPSGDTMARGYGYAGSLTFAASEFARFRLYVQELTGAAFPRSTIAFLQTEIALGAHGAHPY